MFTSIYMIMILVVFSMTCAALIRQGRINARRVALRKAETPVAYLTFVAGGEADARLAVHTCLPRPVAVAA